VLYALMPRKDGGKKLPLCGFTFARLRSSATLLAHARALRTRIVRREVSSDVESMLTYADVADVC
jgi:hypothetical protein